MDTHTQKNRRQSIESNFQIKHDRKLDLNKYFKPAFWRSLILLARMFFGLLVANGLCDISALASLFLHLYSYKAFRKMFGQRTNQFNRFFNFCFLIFG